MKAPSLTAATPIAASEQPVRAEYSRARATSAVLISSAEGTLIDFVLMRARKLLDMSKLVNWTGRGQAEMLSDQGSGPSGVGAMATRRTTSVEVDLRALVKRLRQLIDDRATSAAQVSREAGLGNTAVSDILSGKNKN